MRVFVTGANGFIGRHLIRHLCAADHQVIALVRPGTGAGLPPAVRRVEGDLNAVAAWQTELAPCDAVIHLAARYRIGGVDRKEMASSNVAGTRHVLHAAWRAGIQRIVHVSSTAALGETFGRLEDEDHLHNGRFRSFYEQTKHVAHGLAEALQQRGAPLIIAIPGGAFGTGDGSDLAQALGQFVRGKLPLQIASTSRFQLCPVEALCDGLGRVLERGTPGRNYLLTGQSVGMEQLIARAADVCQLPRPKTVNPGKLEPAARVCDLLRPLGLRLPLSREALQVMDGSTYLYGSARAESELAWPWQKICGEFETRFDAYVAELHAAAGKAA
jgi:dihydroflavonol-4-reductase